MSDHFGTIPINVAKPSSPPPGEPDKTIHHKPTPPAKQGRRKKLFFFLLPVLLLISYFLTGFYLAPLLIREYLPKYINNSTGLELTIDTIRVNPLNFQLTLTGIRADLPNSAAAQPLLQNKFLFIDLDLISLLRRSFVCDKLTIQGLALSLIRREDNSYNVPALSLLSSDQNQGEIIHFAKLPFFFSLNNIDISDSRILFDDRITGSSHTVTDLQLAIPTLSNFSFQSANYIQPHFSAIVNGSKIQLSGEAVQLADNQGFQTRLSCSILDLDLVPYFSYLPAAFPMTLSQGVADTRLEISFSPDSKQESQLSIDIRMTATDLKMKEKYNDLQIDIPSLELEAVLVPIGRRLHIKSISTREMALTGSRKTAADSLNKFLTLSQKSSATQGELTIDQLLADQCRVTLYGKKEGSRSTSSWNSLQLSIKDFSTTHPSGSIRLSAQQTEGGGDFSWQGQFTESGTLQGKLQLNTFPAADLFHLPGSVPGDSVQGTARLLGDLSFSTLKQKSVRHSLDNAMLQINNLKLTHGEAPWLEAGSLRLTRLSQVDDHYNIGNIFLKNTTLNLTIRELPPLLSHLFTDKQRPQIKGLDFSGEILIRADQNQKSPLHLLDVHWLVSNLDQTDATGNLIFDARLPSEGSINATGTIHPDPAEIQAETTFSGVDFSLLSSFFPQWPLLTGSRATLQGEGTFHFPDSSFLGSLKLTDTLLQNNAESPLISWDLAEFTRLECNFSPFSLKAENLSLNAPYLHWQHSSVPPLQQFQKAAHTLFTDRSGKETLFPVTIKKISFQNGTMTILDQRLSPPWQTTVNSVKGRINNLDTRDDGLSSFTLTGTMEDSPLSLAGTAALFRSPPDARIRLKLSGFPLASFQKQLAATPIDPGSATFYLQMDMVQEHSHLSGSSEMIIKDLTPATAASDTALALALLKNTEGSFPLTVSMDDSSQSLFHKALNSFQTRLIKASYAPLLLVPDFADLQDNTLIIFHPGTSTLSAAGREILIRYAELLSRHPELGLVVTGMTDGQADREVLQTALEEKEQQRIDEVNTKREVEYRKKQQHPPTTEAGNTLQEETIAAEELTEYAALPPQPVHVRDEELLDLARERSLIVYDFCTHSLTLAPLRISLAERGEIGSSSPANGVRIDINTISGNVD